MSDKGLYAKFEVLRNGDPIEDCFVLRYDRDRHALVALAAYAASVRTDDSELSDDLWRLVKVETRRRAAAVPDRNEDA